MQPLYWPNKAKRPPNASDWAPSTEQKNDKVFTNLIVDSFEFLDPLKKQDQEKSQTQDDDQYDDWSDLGTEIDFDDVVPF